MLRYDSREDEGDVWCLDCQAVVYYYRGVTEPHRPCSGGGDGETPVDIRECLDCAGYGTVPDRWAHYAYSADDVNHERCEQCDGCGYQVEKRATVEKECA